MIPETHGIVLAKRTRENSLFDTDFLITFSILETVSPL
jgi:hypothetical protein